MKSRKNFFLITSLGFLAALVVDLRSFEYIGGFLTAIFDGVNIILQDEEIGMPLENIIRKHGYPVEIHDIVTEDGYILQAFRIPHGKNGSENARVRHGEPVLINHPFLCSAADYFVLDPDGAIPFMYADAGFDVWVGNFRGNSLSARHKTYSWNEARFWDFVVDDLALYDIPAQIDYILNATKWEQLVYYGFSKGGGIAIHSLSLKPEYNKKIRRMTIVAPSCHMSHSNSVLLNQTLTTGLFLKLYDSLFNGQLVTTQVLKPLAPFVCSVFPSVCVRVLKAFNQYNPGQITEKSMVRLSRIFPNLTSLRVYLQGYHWYNTGNVSRQDYGKAENLKRYGTPAPPLYDYSRVTVPTCGLYSLRDNVIEPEDAIRTLSEVSNWCNRDNGFIQDPNWTHIDNMYGKDAGKLVYSRSINFHLQRGDICGC